MNKAECFKIRVLSSDYEDFNVGKMQIILTLKNSKFTFFKKPIDILADPFLFVHNSRLYLFFENKRFRQKAKISMMYTEDLKKWSNPQDVLIEDFHLSYPFVFEDKGKIYMIPETSEDATVRLYVAENDELTKFKFVKTLLDSKSTMNNRLLDYADSSVFKNGEVYYLLTTIKKDGVNNLLLYTSNDLFGTFNEHPQSPICVSNKFGRCGGGMIKYKGELFRIAQDCESGYGDNLNFMKINALDKTNYSEELKYKDVLPVNISFYKNGGHHMNFVKFDGKYIFATDAKEYHYFINNRIYYKLGIYN